MLNNVILIGRLVKDPELRKTSNGKNFIGFTLAVKDNSESATFISCYVWEKQAESMAQYTHKGSLIAVQGKVSTTKQQNGFSTMLITVFKVEFLDPKQTTPSIKIEEPKQETLDYGDEEFDFQWE